MAFQDFLTGLGSEEEVGSSIGIQGAEDSVCGDTVVKKAHTAECIFFIDELHVIDFACGIIHQDKEVEKDTGQMRFWSNPVC